MSTLNDNKKKKIAIRGLGAAMVQYAILRGELNSDTYAPLDISMVTVPYDRKRAVRDTERAEKNG